MQSNTAIDLDSDAGALQTRKILFLHFLTQVAFISDAAAILEKKSMGRIHHRILFLADYLPGISVNELLGILRVTHQNIRVPLRQLVNSKYVNVINDSVDRRQKRLHIAANGKRLLGLLVDKQGNRVERALAKHSRQEIEAFMKISLEMVDPQDADWVNKR